MTEFKVDKRDLEFILYDQFNLEGLTKLKKYNEHNRELYDMILDSGIKFATEQMAPTYDKADKIGCKVVDGQVIVPEMYHDLFKQYCEQGWLAIPHKPELGGMGLPIPLAIAMLDIFIGASTSFMFFGGLTVAAGHLIENFGRQELKDLVVPKMYAGEWTGTMCLTEPQAGTAVGDVKTTATPIEGSDEFLIKGSKIFITCGDHDLTDNIIHLVLARTAGDPEGIKGISLFLVPKKRFDATGKLTGSNDVALTSIEHKMGIHASPTCSLSFGDNDDCRGYLIGEQRQGIIYMFQMMNEARITCGVQGSGIANASYLMALDYAKERVQGTRISDRSPDAGKVAIIDHPDVRRNLMLCKAISEGIRALLLQASFYADVSINHEDEAVRTKHHDLLELLTPVCKAYATDQGFKVTELAIQIHGGYGYISEYKVEQYMRDLKIASIYEGTNGIQALDLVGRKMRAKSGGVFLTWLQEANTFLLEHKEHPRLSDIIAEVDKGKNTLAKTAFGFGQRAKADMEAALIGATPFLEMFGHVEVARLLAQQATIADTKLQALLGDNTSEEAYSTLLENSSDARYFDGKIKTARFFANTILPHARALAKEIENADRSALDIHFD